MERAGRYALGIAVVIIGAFAVNTVIGEYANLSPVEREHFWAMARTVFTLGGIGILCLVGGILLALAVWSSIAPKLSDRRRKEIHNATED